MHIRMPNLMITEELSNDDHELLGKLTEIILENKTLSHKEKMELLEKCYLLITGKEEV